MQVAQVARKRGNGRVEVVGVRGLWLARYERERACCMVMVMVMCDGDDVAVV